MVQQQTFIVPLMNMFTHFANILLFFLRTPRGRASRYYLNKELCPASKLLTYRKCVVSKQTSLIYTIHDTSIFLITFIDNRALHNY